MFFCRCALIPANLFPDVPTIDRLPTLPRRLRSKSVKPTTPTFLSEPEADPPTYPVVYSPVPTMHTFSGAMVLANSSKVFLGVTGRARESLKRQGMWTRERATYDARSKCFFKSRQQRLNEHRAMILCCPWESRGRARAAEGYPIYAFVGVVWGRGILKSTKVDGVARKETLLL